MFYVYLICFFVLGTFMGSFYALVGMRLPKNKKIVFTRSCCDSCNNTLKFYDMIPIFSYLFLKGRCRYCKEKIPVVLPIIELSTGLLYAVSFYSFGFSLSFLLGLFIIALFMIVVVSDILYLIIPDEVLLFFSIAFIIIQFFNIGLYETGLHILTGLFLFAVMYLIMCLGNFLFKKESLGGGDIKMLFLFGLVLDPLLGTFSIFLGSLIALPISMLLYGIYKDNVIPFGPFLLVSFLIIYFTKIDSTVVIGFFQAL